MMNLISFICYFMYTFSVFIVYPLHFYGNCNVFNFRLDFFLSLSQFIAALLSPLYVINYGTVLTLATRLNSIELMLLLLLLLFCFKLTLQIRYVQNFKSLLSNLFPLPARCNSFCSLFYWLKLPTIFAIRFKLPSIKLAKYSIT